jgi:four helix bundle protein
MDGKIQNFTDLLAWKEGHKLVLLIYSVSKSFPKEEIFGLTSQMRRCAVSVSSNVAEGFSRQSYKEKIQFYSISLGSITELQNQLLISKDIGYITPEIFKKIVDQTISVQKLNNGLIKFSKSQLLNT